METPYHHIDAERDEIRRRIEGTERRTRSKRANVVPGADMVESTGGRKEKEKEKKEEWEDEEREHVLDLEDDGTTIDKGLIIMTPLSHLVLAATPTPTDLVHTQIYYYTQI